MDKDLIDGTRRLFVDNLFDLVRRNYNVANRDYLQKQIKIASDYLTDEQKKDLRNKGYEI